MLVISLKTISKGVLKVVLLSMIVMKLVIIGEAML